MFVCIMESTRTNNYVIILHDHISILFEGEDGSEMSAAGQMETVLGVKGIEKVILQFHSMWRTIPTTFTIITNWESSMWNK